MEQTSSTSVHEALSVVCRLLDELDFPFDSASASATRREFDEVQTLLEQYVLPRLQRKQAPLLVAFGGSTGVGKSTLVNALVGEVVTAAGVLRPTTRVPLVVHHPDDRQWFAAGDESAWFTGGHTLYERYVCDGVPPGVALLDTPPLGSVVSEIRLAAVESLTAADLWLFVTTAARYADAVPWHLLHEAAERRSVVAVVLNRLPADSANEVRAHLASLLVNRGLGDAPLFVMEEVTLDSSGLPATTKEVEPLRRWLRDLAGNEKARLTVAERTVNGTIDSVLRRIVTATAEAEPDVLDESARTALAAAVTDVREAREAAS